MRHALVVGLSGEALTPDEATFLNRVRPAGIIVFSRNAVARDQLARLIDDAVMAVGDRDLLVLVDQEGGRVRRLRPPVWRDLPAAASYGRLFERDPVAAQAAAMAIARLTAHDLRSIGINMNCAPCIDLLFDDADAIIGDRAYGRDVDVVVALAAAVAEGYMAGGVVPVIKHIPGHGRAGVDSHLALPVVEARDAELDRADFAPFKALAGLPAAMTGHVVYSAIDPSRPATTSPAVLENIVRDRIGFDGLLISDDLSMKALTGSLTERASAAFAAGCDLALHCNGEMDEMRAVAEATPVLVGAARDRLEACLAITRQNPGPPEQSIVVEAEKWLMQLGAA